MNTQTFPLAIIRDRSRKEARITLWRSFKWVLSPLQRSVAPRTECRSGTLPVSGDNEPSIPVAEVVFSKIKPGSEDIHLAWLTRVRTSLTKYPGYHGTFVQPAEDSLGFWITVIRFDSASNLQKWRTSRERMHQLRESRAFILQKRIVVP